MLDKYEWVTSPAIRPDGKRTWPPKARPPGEARKIVLTNRIEGTNEGKTSFTTHTHPEGRARKKTTHTRDGSGKKYKKDQ